MNVICAVQVLAYTTCSRLLGHLSQHLQPEVGSVLAIQQLIACAKLYIHHVPWLGALMVCLL